MNDGGGGLRNLFFSNGQNKKKSIAKYLSFSFHSCHSILAKNTMYVQHVPHTWRHPKTLCASLCCKFRSF